MQQTEQTAGWGGRERKRVEAVVETLAALRSGGENLAELTHDARNLVTALGLYCDLLDGPGVLAAPYVHYGDELRMVVAASRKLVEKLVDLDARNHMEAAFDPRSNGAEMGEPRAGFAGRPQQHSRWDAMPPVPIDNLAEELLANRNLLAALAGPAITLTLDTESGGLPVRLNGEDLTRVLVNLIKNAAEAMPAGGRIHLNLRERPQEPSSPRRLLLTIDDSGPGIPEKTLDRVFDAGFTTRSIAAGSNGWPGARRGLGLSIARSIVEAAGGRIYAANGDRMGTRMTIELPVPTR